MAQAKKSNAVAWVLGGLAAIVLILAIPIILHLGVAAYVFNSHFKIHVAPASAPTESAPPPSPKP